MASETIQLFTKSFNKGPKEFGASLKDFSIQSSLEFVVSGSNFEASMKSLSPPFPFQKALRKIYRSKIGSESWNPVP